MGPGQQGDVDAPTATTRPTRTSCFDEIAWPAERLPPVRDRPLHRRAATGSTACGRATACSCPAYAARAGGRVRRELRGARRRLRQPRALRAARLVTRASRGHDDPGRGLVPPGARRHHHQHRRRPRSGGTASAPTPPVRRDAGPRVPGPEQADPLRGHDVHRGLPHPARRRTAAGSSSSSGDPERSRRSPRVNPSRSPRSSSTAFTEAYWRNLAWRKTTGSGSRVDKSPGDLVMYQEIVSEIRPDWIIEQRTGNGGRALFFAIDLRAARPRPGAVHRRPGTDSTCPSTRACSYSGRAHPRRGDRRGRATTSWATDRAPWWCSAPAAVANRMVQRVRDLPRTSCRSART